MEFVIEDNEGVERLTQTALKTLNKFRLPFVEEIGELRIGQFLFRKGTIGNQAAIGILATSDLRVEDYGLPAARTGSFRSFLRAYLHRQQLFGNLCGIDLDTPVEGGGIHFAGSDFREGEFPLPRHSDIGNLLVFYRKIDCQTLIGGNKVLLLASPSSFAPRQFKRA